MKLPRVLDNRTWRRAQQRWFTRDFIDQFVRLCNHHDLFYRAANFLNYTEFTRRGDKIEYCPDEDVIIIRRVWLHSTCPRRSDSDPDIKLSKEIYHYGSAVWIPSVLRFASTPPRKRAEFLQTLAHHYYATHLRNSIYTIRMSELPSYLRDDPHYIKAAEKLIAAAQVEYRGRAVGWLQVDPERLSVELQALAVESVLKGA